MKSFVQLKFDMKTKECRVVILQKNLLLSTGSVEIHRMSLHCR